MRLPLVLANVFLASLPLPAPSASPPPAIQPEAGFEHLTTPEGIEVGIWFPAHGQPVAMPLGLNVQRVIPGAALLAGKHALVVISHGTGGAYSGHADTAIALAKAGFIVAALTHPGDNWRDQSRVAMVEDRPRALSALIDMMLTTWHGAKAVDAGRIAAFGFSAGGFTVLAEAGGRPDLSTIARHCADHPTWFDCRLLAGHPHPDRPAWSWQGDRRVKALVVAAPALGFAFDRAGLASLTMPIQLWRADDDDILPAPDYADAVRAALPKAPEFHAVRKAGHFDFLMPCTSPDALPEICSSKPGFDRAAFHRAFNARIVRFLKGALYERRAGYDSVARASGLPQCWQNCRTGIRREEKQAPAFRTYPSHKRALWLCQNHHEYTIGTNPASSPVTSQSLPRRTIGIGSSGLSMI